MPLPPVPAAEAARRHAHIRRLRRRVMVFVCGVPLLLLAVSLYWAFGPKPPPPPQVLPVTPVEAAGAARRIDAVRQALTQASPALAPKATAPHTHRRAEAMPPAAIRPLLPHALPPPVQDARGPNGQNLVTLRVSQADVNAYLSSSPKIVSLLRAHAIRAISVQFSPPDDITIHANATLRGVSGNALVVAALTPDPRTAIHLHITDARFGRLPPPVIETAVNAVLGRLLGKSQGLLPVDVQAVQVIGSDLILSGARRARIEGASPS